MTKIRRFEDLVCWQKARVLANTIHCLTLHPNFSKDFKLCDRFWMRRVPSCTISPKDKTITSWIPTKT